jgi:hypothetical protein
MILSNSAANPMAINDDDQTPLDLARSRGHVSVVRMLEVRFLYLMVIFNFTTKLSLSRTSYGLLCAGKSVSFQRNPEGAFEFQFSRVLGTQFGHEENVNQMLQCMLFFIEI